VLINGPRDHVHLLFVLPASVALSQFMQKIKANPSRWIHEQWPEQASFSWQTGYAAFSVSESNLGRVREYVARQEEHHRRLSFQEEVVAFLKKHGIEYDPRYVFE